MSMGESLTVSESKDVVEEELKCHKSVVRGEGEGEG